MSSTEEMNTTNQALDGFDVDDRAIRLYQRNKSYGRTFFVMDLPYSINLFRVGQRKKLYGHTLHIP